MLVLNKTNNIVIADNCKVADRFFSRFLGLMGKKSLPQGSGLLIKPCNSIHMFFMKIPLDIVFIDESSSVIYLIENIKPWHISKLVRGAVSTIELPAGTIQHCNISIGDKFEFIWS
jgi:hypothetical protein